MVGKIQRVGLREVWRHEALDFTTWLEENIDVLSDALDLTIMNAEREQAAGDFSVDIVGEDNLGNIIVIENQLERSNHDHLGKLITYLTALEAKIAIWIVAEPRPEHVKAVAWLNESSAASFYLVKVEAIKIEDSLAAPLLTLITGPSEEAKTTGVTKKEIADRYVIRKRFWTGLLEKAKQKTQLHSGTSPSQYQWITSRVGLPSGLSLNYTVRNHDASVGLYIDSDRDTGEGNKAILHQLMSEQPRIEESFGQPLEWHLLEGKRACRISKNIPIAGWKDEERWPEAHVALVDGMIALERALRPFLKQITSPNM